MKIVQKAVKRLYHFECCNCGSKLEVEPGKLMDVGNKISKFYCPTCDAERYIGWNKVHVKTIYENEG